MSGPIKVEILGSGGAIPLPRPGCQCAVCAQARQQGPPYSRCGPSVFVHGPDVLIDTPEDIRQALNHSTVRRVPTCLYSHWHPDHTMGRRIFENLNGDWLNWPRHNRETNVYLPPRVAQDARERLDLWGHLAYMQHIGIVNVHALAEDETITREGYRIRPFALAEDYVYGFLFEPENDEGPRDRAPRVLVLMDELFGWWDPPESVQGVDLVVLPMGIPQKHPLTGADLLPAEHPVFKVEATFTQTLDIVRRLKAQRVIMSHIELDVLSYDDLKQLETQLRADGINITFAYDGLLIEL